MDLLQNGKARSVEELIWHERLLGSSRRSRKFGCEAYRGSKAVDFGVVEYWPRSKRRCLFSTKLKLPQHFACANFRSLWSLGDTGSFDSGPTWLLTVCSVSVELLATWNNQSSV
jgi:hypothetical protein